jgi:hypothetical protein
LGTAAKLKRNTHEVRLNGGVHPRAHLGSGVRWLRANLEVSVTQRRTNSVDASMVSSLQKVNVLKTISTVRAQLLELGVRVLRKEVTCLERGTSVAARRKTSSLALDSLDLGELLVLTHRSSSLCYTIPSSSILSDLGILGL